MKYVVESEKPVAQATEDLKAAVSRHGFGVLHEYDLKATLASKGFELEDECRILEICNPKQAHEVLSREMDMNIMLPCRVSVYSDRGRTRIAMARPTLLLRQLSESPKLMDVAEEVEQKTTAMIEEAR